MGERGDLAREFVLDRPMIQRLERRQIGRALDVGCGEGRFCRIMRARGIDAVGIDPTQALLDAARTRDPGGDYRLGRAEALEFSDGSFDLVVSYLTLIDIADFRAAIREMSRVLAPRGTLLIANLTSFTSGWAKGWVRDENGVRLYTPVDRYLDEFAADVSWRGITIENWHRPLSAYMSALLAQNLRLIHFAEPDYIGPDTEYAAYYRRAPWFLIMEWESA